MSEREQAHTQSHIFSTLFKAVFMLAREADGKTFVSIFTQISVHSLVNTLSVSTALCNTEFPSAEPFAAAI